MNHRKIIRDFVIANFLFGEGSSLQDDTSFIDSGTVDSTGMLELIMFIEESYPIKVLQDEMLPENFDSINRVVQFLMRKMSGAEIIEQSSNTQAAEASLLS